MAVHLNHMNPFHAPVDAELLTVTGARASLELLRFSRNSGAYIPRRLCRAVDSVADHRMLLLLVVVVVVVERHNSCPDSQMASGFPSLSSADSLRGRSRETLLFDNPAYLYAVTRPHVGDGGTTFFKCVVAAALLSHRMKMMHYIPLSANEWMSSVFTLHALLFTCAWGLKTTTKTHKGHSLIAF